jgi:competence protein ComEC
MQAERPTSGPQFSTASTADATPHTSVIPLFHAAWLFSLGIAFTWVVWPRPSIVLLALGPVAALCCVAAIRAQRIVWLPLAVLWCMLGAWCAEMEPHPAAAPIVSALSDGLLRTVEGTIVDAAPMRSERVENVEEAPSENPSQRVDVRVASIELVTDAEDRQVPADGSVRLTVRWPQQSQDQPLPRGFTCGERIRAVVRLLPPEEYRDPGAWSRTDYLLDQGITSSGSVNLDRVEDLGPAQVRSLHCHLVALQHASSARLLALPAAMQRFPAALRLSDDDAVMLAAMTTGDRTYLTHSLRVGFERTGSFHMLVVSGFHLAIVAGCFFWITRRVRLPRVPAMLITIVASFAYALFTGFATPVQRSLWMVTLYLLGTLIYRERSPLNAIGFASLCLLAVSPRSFFDSSLQMTLLAVVAIAGIAAPLLDRSIHPFLVATRDLRTVAIDIKLEPRLAQFRVVLRMIASRLQRAISTRVAWRIFPWSIRFALRCIELLVVSCVVELAMTLPMAIYFHRITVFALPVNIFILPLLGLLMPAALLTLLTLLAWPAAAVVPAMVAALLLHSGIWMVHLFGSLALGDFRIPAPLAWQSAAFCVLLAAAIMLAHRPGRPVQRDGSPSRSSLLSGVGAGAALALAAVAAVLPRPVDHPHNALFFKAIDVGQGDSLLLITPDGKTVLVDGGGFGGGPRQAPQDFDIGEEVVSPALWARGIRHLDVVALSHAHSDHMGGLPAVLRNFHPSELWVGNNPRVAAYIALLEEANQLGVTVRTLRAGDMLTLGDTSLHVLAPFRDYQPGAEPANNDSLVLHIAYGDTSVMLEGDAEAPIEESMLSESGLQSTLLKIGHHGSVTSTRPEFLARVTPQWAVISCGLHNRYHHPREEVLAELQATKVRTYSTDIQGAGCFQLDGIEANAVPCEEAGFR